MLKESRYVRLANTMFRVLKKARIPLFLRRKSNQSYIHSMAAFSIAVGKTV